MLILENSLSLLALRAISQNINKKTWGVEYVLANTPKYCLKFMEIFPRKKCSLHFHRQKQETFIPLSESIKMRADIFATSDWYKMKTGELYTILPEQCHQFANSSRDTSAWFIEVSTFDSPDDVERKEMSGTFE